MIDIHSHILPGIDDGADVLADSVNIVRELAEQGVTDIIATPHYIEETIYTSLATRNAVLADELKWKLMSEGIAVNIHLGNEIFINERIVELINARKVATLAGSKYLLVELPMSGEYPSSEDILLNLKQLGYEVVLAHPERYSAVQKNYKLVEDWHEMGILLQCNIGSILGQYGKHAKKVAQKLAKHKMIFAFGSDIHHTRGENYIIEAQERLGKYYDEQGLTELLVENPGKILRGE